MNNVPVISTVDGDDFTGREFAAMLPNSTDAFDVTYKDGLNYTSFYEEVYAARNEGDAFPYSFGSYQIY